MGGGGVVVVGLGFGAPRGYRPGAGPAGCWLCGQLGYSPAGGFLFVSFGFLFICVFFFFVLIFLFRFTLVFDLL